MGNTLIEKILSAKVGRGVSAGEILNVPVDSLLINDYVGTLIFSKLEEIGCKHIVAPEKVFLAIDHAMPAFTTEAADKQVALRENAAKYGITRVCRVGKHGIGHQMMAQHYVKPLEIAFGTDSHASMYGGVSAFGCGITTSDAIAVMLTGKLWIRVPETIRILISGKLPLGVTAKDLILRIVSMLPEEEYAYKAVELVGEAIESLSVDSRLVLANMIAECGAKCALFEADEKAYTYTGLPKGSRFKSDEDASLERTIELDVSEMKPLLASPDTVFNVHPVDDSIGTHVDQVFIGSCTNGRMEDMLQTYEVIKGRQVAEGTRMLITPATQEIAEEMAERGLTKEFLRAGAVIMPSSCASCAGNGPGLIGKGEVCVSTTNRNFKGRMGSSEASIYLASAYTAAACAVAGEIVNPLSYLESGVSK